MLDDHNQHTHQLWSSFYTPWDAGHRCRATRQPLFPIILTSFSKRSWFLDRVFPQTFYYYWDVFNVIIAHTATKYLFNVFAISSFPIINSPISSSQALMFTLAILFPVEALTYYVFLYFLLAASHNLFLHFFSATFCKVSKCFTFFQLTANLWGLVWFYCQLVNALSWLSGPQMDRPGLLPRSMYVEHYCKRSKIATENPDVSASNWNASSASLCTVVAWSAEYFWPFLFLFQVFSFCRFLFVNVNISCCDPSSTDDLLMWDHELILSRCTWLDLK